MVQTISQGNVRLRVIPDPVNPDVYLLAFVQVDSAGVIIDADGGGGGGGGAITAAEGAIVPLGSTTDPAVTSDVAGTLIAFIRGLVKIFSSAWDSANGFLIAEINQLHHTEDSILAIGEGVTPYSEIITGVAETELIAAPAAGQHIVVKFFSYQLREDVDTTASLRAGAGATDQYSFDLDFATLPLVGKKFEGGGWALPSATALLGKLSVAPSTSGVRFNVEYVVRAD